MSEDSDDIASKSQIERKELLSSPTPFFQKLTIAVISSIILYGIMRYFMIKDEYWMLTFTDMSINVVAGIALAVALMILYKQKLKGLHGKTYASFAVGLVVWFAAEILQTYYEIGTVDDIPFPSLADALWLAAYCPFAYHLFATYRFFSRSGNPYSLMIVSIIVATVFLGITTSIINEFNKLKDGSVIELAVNLAYPIMDAILIIPSVSLLLIMRKGKFTSALWTLLASSILIIAIGDAAFAYYSVILQDEEIWGFSIFYFTGYVCMASALVCHNKFFIFNKAKAVKSWQEKNR